MLVPSVATITSHLLLIPASRQIPHSHRGPAEFAHYSCETAKHARDPIALWDLKKIQQRLTTDALQPVKEVDLAAHALKPGASGLRSEADCAKPRSPWLESLPSFCTGCGSRAPNSNGRQRRLPINLHSRTTEFPPIRSAGTNVPAGTLALVRSLLVLRCSRKQNAFHTLIHQRHLTPSCGGHAPTAERTLNPARMSRRA